jgi:hypothetical protein
MIAPRLLSVSALCVVAFAAAPAAAQIADAELYQRLHGGVGAEGQSSPVQTEQVDIPPTTTPIGGSGLSSFPIELAVTSGGSAMLTGSVDWLVGPTQVQGSGTYAMTANGSATTTGQAGIDDVFSMRFSVETQTAYTLSGAVRTSKALGGTDRLQCQENGEVLVDAAAASATPGADAVFVVEGVAYPGEQRVVECAVIKSIAASAVTTSDSASLSWRFDVALGASTPTTTTLPLKPKQCRRECRRAAASCRRACGGTRAEKRACRKTCNQLRRGCGADTGCALPDLTS